MDERMKGFGYVGLRGKNRCANNRYCCCRLVLNVLAFLNLTCLFGTRLTAPLPIRLCSVESPPAFVTVGMGTLGMVRAPFRQPALPSHGPFSLALRSLVLALLMIS